MALPSLAHRNRGVKHLKILPRDAHESPSESAANISPRHKIDRARKNVSRACQTCRQRRIRCTTNRPCRPCQVNSVACVDHVGPEDVDLRTIRLGLQNQKTFLRHKTILDQLLQTLRNDTADRVIKCIRDGGSLDEIDEALHESDQSSPKDLGQRSDDDPHKSGHNDDELISTKKRLRSVEHGDASDITLSNFGNLPLSSAIRTNGFSTNIQDRQILHLAKPVWECSPLISEDASVNDAFSRSCFSFRNLARQQLAAGESPDLILSLGGIEMDLLFRDRSPCDPHTVSTWACELLKTFNFLHPTIQLASAEANACLMRWLIAPTKDNYLALPSTSTPIQSQFFVPHSIGVDIMMFPEIRDALLTRNDTRAWTDHVSSNTMSFNWPYSIDACLESIKCQDDELKSCMRLSKAFVEHIRNLNNLSMDLEVLHRFPEFSGKFRWHNSSSSPISSTLIGTPSPELDKSSS